MNGLVAWFSQERNRAYLYRVATTLMVPAVLYGWITAEDVPVWTGVLVAVLGIGTPALASANTSTKQSDLDRQR